MAHVPPLKANQPVHCSWEEIQIRVRVQHRCNPNELDLFAKSLRRTYGSRIILFPKVYWEVSQKLRKIAPKIGTKFKQFSTFLSLQIFWTKMANFVKLKSSKTKRKQFWWKQAKAISCCKWPKRRWWISSKKMAFCFFESTLVAIMCSQE